MTPNAVKANMCIKRLWSWITGRQAITKASEAERHSAIEVRAYYLWVDAGRPSDRGSDQFWYRATQELEQQAVYHFKTTRGGFFVYQKDGTANVKEALAF